MNIVIFSSLFYLLSGTVLWHIDRSWQKLTFTCSSMIFLILWTWKISRCNCGANLRQFYDFQEIQKWMLATMINPDSCVTCVIFSVDPNDNLFSQSNAVDTHRISEKTATAKYLRRYHLLLFKSPEMIHVVS